MPLTPIDPMTESAGHGIDGHVAHSLGRIEEILKGVREDLKAHASEMKEMSEKMVTTNARIHALESWRHTLVTYDKQRIERGRARGAIMTALLVAIAVPTIGWAVTFAGWVHRVHESLPPVSKIRLK